MNNQATVPITTANSRTPVTLTSSSTITTTALGMVSINSVPAICLLQLQDANFQTVAHLLKRNPTGMRASKDAFYKDINLLV